MANVALSMTIDQCQDFANRELYKEAIKYARRGYKLAKLMESIHELGGSRSQDFQRMKLYYAQRIFIAESQKKYDASACYDMAEYIVHLAKKLGEKQTVELYKPEVRKWRALYNEEKDLIRTRDIILNQHTKIR